MPWISLQIVIVVFPDHTHLLFFMRLKHNRSVKSGPCTEALVFIRHQIQAVAGLQWSVFILKHNTAASNMRSYFY